MSLAEHIATRLSSAGVGSTSSTAAWRIVHREFIAGTQGSSTQAQQIAIVPTGGFPNNDNARLERPTFQLLVRAASSVSTGLDLGLDSKLAGILGALDGWAGTIDNWNYTDIRIVASPIWLGRDDNERPIYSLNFEVMRDNSPAVMFEWKASEGSRDGTFTRATTTGAPASYAAVTDVGGWGTVTTAKSGVARTHWIST